MRKSSILILKVLLFCNLSGQEFIHSNSGMYASPAQKGECILNTSFALINDGFTTDLSVLFSPLQSFGLGFNKRIRDGYYKCVGGSFGFYKFNSMGLGIEAYTGIDHERIRRSTYSFWHNRYYTHVGLVKRYDRVTLALYGKLNLIDYTRLNIKRIDSEVVEFQNHIENDFIVFPEINYKINYGGKMVQGYLILNQPIKSKIYKIAQPMNLILGFQINIQVLSDYWFCTGDKR